MSERCKILFVYVIQVHDKLIISRCWCHTKIRSAALLAADIDYPETRGELSGGGPAVYQKKFKEDKID